MNTVLGYCARCSLFALIPTLFLSGCIAEDSAAHPDRVTGGICQGYGPQAPRDIDSKAGENPRIFSPAPSYNELNLCNIHFHRNAEHKARDYSIYAGEGDSGRGGGYRCNRVESLSEEELAAPEGEICKGLIPGDTIEVHWVYSSCAVKPGEGLEACLSNRCTNPDLRVEAQVFTVVNDPAALDFNDFAYGGDVVNGFHQAKSLPATSGRAVEFAGSTTGPKFTEEECSPLQVTWSVRPRCAKVDIHSLGEWCNGNVFQEDHAHGVRKLVTNIKLLSKIE